MELMADLVCNFIRQRAEADAGQGHAFSVFIKFFRLQLGVAGIPDKEEVFVFHQSQFLGNGLCFQQLISILGPTYGLGIAKVTAGGESKNVTITQAAGEQVVVIPEFDYLVLRYGWESEDGSDFDTATGFTNTGISDVDNKYVGWSKQWATTQQRGSPS